MNHLRPEPPLFDRTLLGPGDRLCVAVSGGADSVALLLLLHAANTAPRDGLGVGLSAVHVHHGLRAAEADSDLTFVQSLCDRLGIPLHTHHADVPERVATTHADAAQKSEGVEEAARTLRYAFFRSLLADRQADAVLTAHTLDDQAETVLMKLLRGAWTEGLSGIHPVLALDPSRPSRSPSPPTPTHTPNTEPRPTDLEPRPQNLILRPLLHTRRADLRAWLESIGQPWREDTSNADLAHTRNRIRHTILPLLRQENPSLDRTLANLAELARDDEARWSAELARTLPQLLLSGKPVRGGGRAVATSPCGPHGERSVALDLDRLRSLDPALRRRVLRAAARTLGARLSFDETAALLALGGFTHNPTIAARAGTRLMMSGQMIAVRSARELRLERTADAEPPA